VPTVQKVLKVRSLTVDFEKTPYHKYQDD
jgi:hypothetical protein